MAKLTDLSNELLVAILSPLINDDYNNDFACSLAIFSKRFSRLIRHLLYESVDLSLSPGPYQVKSGKFLRSLKENPELQSLVLKFYVSWEPGDEQTFLILHGILSVLVNLRRLDIQPDWHAKTPFVPRFLEINSMSNLKFLLIRDRHLTLGDINRYMALENLETMVLYCRYLDTTNDPSTSLSMSTVVNLNLKQRPQFCSHVSPGKLHQILKWTPRLKSLRCALPAHDRMKPQNPKWADEYDREIIGPLAPSAISQALIPVKDSLQEISLIACSCKFPLHDQSRMDLSSMKTLRIVNCPARCFLGSTLPYSNRAGFYMLLPLSLEDLTLRFQESCKFLEPRIGGSALALEEQTNTSSEFVWMEELAAWKQHSSSRLRILRLEENFMLEQKHELWSTPPYLAASFKIANIEISDSWLGARSTWI